MTISTALPHDDLHLKEVLLTGLPLTLGTPEAPATYPVAIVVSRRVGATEVVMIESADTSQALDALGYPGLTLTVSDRRLIVDPTSLQQLASGLAGALTHVLREIEKKIARQYDDTKAAEESTRHTEEQRQREVRRLIAAIDLNPETPHPTKDQWEDDGGRGIWNSDLR